MKVALSLALGFMLGACQSQVDVLCDERLQAEPYAWHEANSSGVTVAGCSLEVRR